MRSVARQKYASHPEFCGNALMGLIKVAMNEIVRCRFWKCALKTAVNDFIAERVLVGFIDLGWKAGAPTSLPIISADFEKVHPLLRFGKVIPITACQKLLKIIHNCKNQKSLGPGVSLEIDLECFPDRAASAVGSDQVIGSKLFDSIRTFGHVDDGGRILPYRSDTRFEPNIGVSVLPQSPQTNIGKL